MPSSGSGMIAEASKSKGWRELQGENSWNGLLDPLDLDLRKSIISYGELVQAAGDGFNAEVRSPHLGACLYRPSHLLSGTGVAAAGRYEVTKLLYATSGVVPDYPFLFRPLVAPPPLGSEWDGESNFMGYVAVATDGDGVAALGRRDIVVAWRGTMRPKEDDNDTKFLQTDAEPVLGSAYPNAMVHRGFLSLYTSSNANSKFNKSSAKDQVLEEVRRLMELYKDEEISITVIGYSLGAALAILSAVDMVAHGVHDSSSRPPCTVTAIVFACPRVGNSEFKAAFDSFSSLKTLHVRNQDDIVPTIPWSVWPTIEYVSVGVTLDIQTEKSTYLRKITDFNERLGVLHNLECYLHGVAGEQGGDAPFKLEVDRDVALVNKSTNALKEEYHVPANWWVAQNKHMVKGADGHWKLNDFEL